MEKTSNLSNLLNHVMPLPVAQQYHIDVKSLESSIESLLYDTMVNNPFIGVEKDDYLTSIWIAIYDFDRRYQISDIENLTGYLYRIVENRVRDYTRQLNAKRYLPLNDGVKYKLGGSAFKVNESQDTFDNLTTEMVEYQRRTEQLIQFIQDMQTEYINGQKITTLARVVERWTEGFTRDEIANEFHISVRTVLRTIERYRAKLSQMLQDVEIE